MKPNNIDEYFIFLASPGDVEDERKEVREFFNFFNRTTAARWKVRFTVIDWENYSNIGVGRPQELITSQTLEKFRDSLALVVGIMGQRFGSPTGTHESGTEEEFEWAFNSNVSTGFPEIKWFFKELQSFQAPADISKIEYALEQWKKVQGFKSKLRSGEPPIYYGSFVDTADFREKLRNDLTLWLNDEQRPWIEGLEQAEKKNSEIEISDFQLDYYQSLEQTYKSLDIRGIDNDKAVDIPLSEVYVRLRVIRDENIETDDEQDQDFGELDIHEALSRYNRLVIVGDPGSGKSTFLKFIALILAQSKIAGDAFLAKTKLSLSEPLPIPFFVSLWDLSDFIKRDEIQENKAISEFILNRLSDFNIQISPEELEKIFKSGNCCLLFDGLDEVPTEQGRAYVSRILEKFVSQYKENRYVVTSRVRGYTGDTILKNDFIRCDIQDFDANDRAEFLKNWFSALFRVDREEVIKEGTKSNAEFTELHNSIEAKDRIRSLAVNPLLMTVIAIVHWNRKRLPDQRVDLYDECIDVLLGQRKIAERIGQGKAVEVLDEIKVSDVQYDRAWTRKRFGEIALLILQSGDKEEANRTSVIDLLIPRFLDRGAESTEKAKYQAETFLDNQELKSGLLVSRHSRSCRFVHLTFQEYLAAWNLANQSINEVKVIISNHLRNPSWFEALQLLGGELAKNSDEKLDEYISFLLENIGLSIYLQAPIIALCANILSDVKGVADIKSETQQKYLTALRGTLDTFKPDSLISPTVQLEVLFALARLGASVKEHLIQATKSSYFQVRSEALRMLITHLSDEDLFGMQHVFKDRSQEPILIYVMTLFARDKERALEIIKNRKKFTPKDIKALSFVLVDYFDSFESDEILRILENIIEFYDSENLHFYRIVLILKRDQTLFERFRKMIINNIETQIHVSESMQLMADMYSEYSETWEILNSKALGKDGYFNWRALWIISRNPEKYTGSWDSITKIAKFSKLGFFRNTAFSMLINQYTEFGSIERKILTRDLDGINPLIDNLQPINKEWIKKCASKFNKDESEIIRHFEKLAEILPITLKK